MNNQYDPECIGPAATADDPIFDENFGAEADASPGACFAYAHDPAAGDSELPDYDYDGEDTDLEDEDDAEEMREEKEEAAAARRRFP